MKRAVVLLLVLLLCAMGAWAQSHEGRILGTVTDQTGAVIASAKVTITNVETGLVRNLVTTDAGDYVAPALPPGLYKIIVEAPNFKKMERSNIRLEVAKDVHIDAQLQPGAASESVIVTAETPLVETTNTVLGGTFSNQTINDLPLNGRDFQNLVVLRPGVARTPGGGFLSISSNGNRPEDNNFIVDGTDNNDPYYGTTVINAEGVQGTPGTILPIDAIQEFNAQENPPAEYGWKPGAIINLGLKSGTNDLHGTAYYFHRNNAFDARNFFNTKPDDQRGLRQHQYGGSVGGPIVKNKTFYFFSYEGIRAQVGNSNLANAPATSSIGGDPSVSIPDAIADLAANGIAVNPLSQQLLSLFPTNDGTNSLGPDTITTGFPNNNRMDAAILKMDHRFNDHHSLTGRYFFGDSLQIEQDITVLRPEFLSTSDLRAQVIGGNWVWTPTSNWVNEAKFGYNRFFQRIVTADASVPPTFYGINTGVTDPANFGLPTIAISGFTQLGGNSGWPLLTTPNETYQFTDNVSYTRGKHTYRFGGEFRFGQTSNLRHRRGKGRIRFEGDGAFAGSTPLEDFLAGFPSRGDIFVGNNRRHASIKSVGFFAQDEWRLTPRLTINAGVRYDLSAPIKERDDLLGNFDPSIGLQQVGVNIDKPYSRDNNNFAPRLGVAYDLFGNGKTVLRAGGSVIYEIPILVTFLGQNGLNNATTVGLNAIPTGAIGSNIAGTIVSAATTQRSGLNWSLAGPVFNVSLNCDPSAGGTPCDILGAKRDLKTPYVITYNVNLQQQLTNTTSLQLAYVGNRGVKLYSIRDINQVDPNSAAEAACGNCEQDGRPFNAQFPFLGFINFLENGYTSDYHGLQVTVTQRAWKGLNFVAGYTWSHSIDDASLIRAQQPQNSLQPGLERGNSALDQRHKFTLSLTYDLPSIKTKGQILEGWQMNNIVTLQSGTPYDALDFENDNSLTGEFSDRYNLIGDPRSIPNFSVTGPIPFQNVLEAPTCPGQCFGNSGRNIFVGPKYKNWDFSLVKNTKLTERVTMQLRGEFFNILNHPNFANPAILFTNDLGVPESFGQVFATPDVAAANPVIGSGGPRNIQIGLKFKF